ncbi:MAG: glycoside hydrolase family 24 protein [Almyronema sp.]
MPSPPPPPTQSPVADVPAKPPREDHGPLLITALMFLGVAWIISRWIPYAQPTFLQGGDTWVETPIPLVMQGGDPYIRALMRTISASESNLAHPYHVLYGGDRVQDLSQHPDQCVPIVAGPNVGDCTTAAGRYQFLTTTWLEKAQVYHPQPPPWFEFWESYSFEPQYQDWVVYQWLNDEQAWGVSIADLLRQGEIYTVLEMLSGTWTSLGYGIEDNSMSAYLPQIYAEMLQEELAKQ